MLHQHEGQFGATITAIETNGAESYVHADVDTPEGGAQWVIKTPGMVNYHKGQAVRLSVQAGDILEWAA